jgi:hypothetical protein
VTEVYPNADTLATANITDVYAMGLDHVLLVFRLGGDAAAEAAA